ncbi:MAG: hypothetical protein HOY69_18115 [Streptomyces sp.]|nr:hypothetical protein [Streptomyces sp.]
MNRKTALRALGTAAAAAGLAIGLSGTAQAETGYTNGQYVTSQHQVFAGCVGDLQYGTSNATNAIYARGMFILNTSTRTDADGNYLMCQGWLQRSTDGGRTWTDISDVHVGYGGVHAGTSYYYDGPGYLARVCVGDFLYYNSYSCGSGA